MQKVFVYDPTLKDKKSVVRGIGRYLQILKESFGNSWIFTDNIKWISADSIFINSFYNFLRGPLTLRRLAQKQIAVIHDLIPLKYPNHFPAGIRGNINIFLNKLALKNYDLIITDSEASKSDIINILKIKSEKLRVIYPCLLKVFIESQNSKVKIQKLNLKVKSNATTFDFSLLTSNFCLYVGDATWNKNLVNLARAIKIANVTCVFVGKVFENLTLDIGGSRLDKEVRNLKLENQTSNIQFPNPTSNFKYLTSILSHPWQRELKEFFELTKNDRRFIFAGFIPDSELFKLYKQASVNLLLSKAEGFGFSYLEAANFSCPSLLSDIPVLREISAGNAFFANPLNPRDIADKIKEINSDKILRNKIGVDAKKRSEYFSKEKFKREFLSVI